MYQPQVQNTINNLDHVQNIFSVIEHDIDCLNDKIISDIVLHGKHQHSVLYVIRNAFSKSTAEKLIKNFDEKSLQTQGGNREYDGYVHANQIGATQFSCNGSKYIKNVIQHNADLTDVLNRLEQNEIEEIFLTGHLEKIFINQAIIFGPARFKSGYSSFISLRRWLDNGIMSLWPHDDSAQLTTAKEDHFEISNADHVISFNACVEAAHEGGLLKVWNFRPDNAFRKQLGVEHTGYPYPLELVDDIQSIEVKLNQGDMYFLNASYLHGVTSVSSGRRLSAGRFIGQISENKVVFWT